MRVFYQYNVVSVTLKQKKPALNASSHMILAMLRAYLLVKKMS